MSGTQSNRPLPPHIYRRRRLALLAAVLTIVGVVMVVSNLIGAALGGGGLEASNQLTPSVSPSASAPTVTLPVEPCVDSTVLVSVSTDKPVYQAGEIPQLTVHVQNTGTVACTFNAGTAVQVLRISGEQELYWQSTDCQTESSNSTVELPPGQRMSTNPIPWDRTISSPTTCNVERPAVPAGGATYYFDASVNDIGAESNVSFVLN